MQKLKIIRYPNPVLKQKAAPVRALGKADHRIIQEMIELMYADDGVGLAAPQVGISKRIIIVSPEAVRGREQILVNPEITYFSSEKERAGEGCLSVPGISGDVWRSKTVEFKAEDAGGKLIQARWDGFAARVIQHEIDHLNGILFIDRLELNEKEKALGSYQRL